MDAVLFMRRALMPTTVGVARVPRDFITPQSKCMPSFRNRLSHLGSLLWRWRSELEIRNAHDEDLSGRFSLHLELLLEAEVETKMPFEIRVLPLRPNAEGPVSDSGEQGVDATARVR
jgi:hypothetical protein